MLIRLLSAWPLIACIGCGASGPFEYVPVTGKITYEDGTPIPASGIRLQFFPKDAPPKGESYPRSGAAFPGADGRFAYATSYKYADGLLPGKHAVSIDYATDSKGKLLVPKEYCHASTTPIVVDTAHLPMDIKVPRPK